MRENIKEHHIYITIHIMSIENNIPKCKIRLSNNIQLNTSRDFYWKMRKEYGVNITWIKTLI